MKRPTSSVFTSHWFLSSMVGLSSFVVYCFTMCRTVSFIDAGELASVAGILGIAHPTGYPFFTILTRCFLLVPIPSVEILRLNVFSAVMVGIGVGAFYHLVIALDRFWRTAKRKGNEREREEGREIRVAASVSALVFGFSTTVWSQSVAIEVYGLHIFLVLLTLYAFFEGMRIQMNSGGDVPAQMVLAAYLLGLSFANHMTTILLLPAMAFMYLRNSGFSRPAMMRSARLVPFFGLGLSVYLYLPLRGRMQPPMNWGFPVDIERLIWHVSGKQYRNWMFSSFQSAGKQLTYFFDHFHSEFNWVIVVLILFGVWSSFNSKRELFWFLVIAFASCLFYSINYDIHDIDSYFLLIYIVSGIFACFGIASAIDFVRRNTRNFPLPGVFLALLILPISQAYLNRPAVDESDNYLVDDYTRNVLSGIEKNGVIITYQWDYFVAPSQYYQLVRKERPDVVIIDKELLRRSWYFVQLRNRYPWLMERAGRKVEAFLAELYKFEHDLPYDPRQIESRYVEMVNEFIGVSMKDRAVYLGPEIEPEFGAQYQRIPAGLMIRLAGNPDSFTVPPVRISYRPASIRTRLTQGLNGLYAKMLTSTGAYFLSKGRLSDADSCIENVLRIDPTFSPARAVREQIVLARKKGGG